MRNKKHLCTLFPDMVHFGQRIKHFLNHEPSLVYFVLYILCIQTEDIECIQDENFFGFLIGHLHVYEFVLYH